MVVDAGGDHPGDAPSSRAAPSTPSASSGTMTSPWARIEATGTALRGRPSWDQFDDLTTMDDSPLGAHPRLTRPRSAAKHIDMLTAPTIEMASRALPMSSHCQPAVTSARMPSSR